MKATKPEVIKQKRNRITRRSGIAPARFEDISTCFPLRIVKDYVTANASWFYANSRDESIGTPSNQAHRRSLRLAEVAAFVNANSIWRISLLHLE